MSKKLQCADVIRLQRDLEQLADYNKTPEEGITRILFTKEELAARDYIKTRMEETGLYVEEDGIGNIFGVLAGSDPSLASVWTGSHIDTVPNAGCFDGMTGVVGGIEALRLIKESGMPHKRDIKVIVFTSEEPTRFGKGCLGSRALAGDLTWDETACLHDETGKSLREVLNDLGYDSASFSQIKKKPGDVFASIELHVEQGAVLETLGINIGIVTDISAPTDITVEVSGTQEHAGATPMYLRHDALAASVELMMKLEQLAETSANPSTVATVGKVEVYPGATNVIPGRVSFSIDLRSSDFEEKQKIIKNLDQYACAIASSRGVIISLRMICHEKPAKSSDTIVNLLHKICDEKQQAYHKMVSGAYHDSMFVSKFAPFGMIFVPSKGGISHHKDEWTDYEDIAKGVDLLAEALYRLSCEEDIQ